jgi:integrase
MATIRKTPLSPFYQAVITLPDGRRTNKSTKTTNKAEAYLLAAQFQTAADKLKDGTLTTDHARKVLNSLLEQAGQDLLNNDTVENFLREWVKGKLNESTRERYSKVVEVFIKNLGRKAQSNLTAIGHRDIFAFMEARQNLGLAPRTLSVDVIILKSAFNTARRMGFITDNAVDKAMMMRPIDIKFSEHEAFTVEQVQTLLNTAKGEWVAMVLLGYCVGARIGDCASMEWSNINFEKNLIDFVQQKTKRRGNKSRVVCPLHPLLETHLRKLLAVPDKTSDFLCPKLAQLASGGKSGLSGRFAAIMRKAGIDQKKAKGKGQRMFSKLTFHSFRHCFNSLLANNGFQQEVRTALTGHSSSQVNDDYTHFDIPKLQQAVRSLPMLNLSQDGI